MRVCFLNRFYWPDEPATAQLLGDLAEGLAARGHEISVIASRTRDDVPAEENRHGVMIRRVRTTRWGRRGLVGRAVDFASFYLGAARMLARQLRRDDVLVSLTDPPLIGVLAARAARRRGAQLVHWVQDIYPEIAIELAGQRWLRATRGPRDRAWRQAAACVTLGSDMASVLQAAGVAPGRIRVIPNWAPAGLAPAPAEAVAAQRAAWGLADRFAVVYSGNLGRVHDLEPVLDVATELRDDPAIGFVFVGDGAQRAALVAAAEARGLHNVQFQPPQPRDRLAVTLSLADVHLVTLRPGCERLVYPSKLAGIAGVHRPAIFIGPRQCEVARTVTSAGFGLAFTRDDAADLALAIRALRADATRLGTFRQAAAQFAAGHSPAVAVERWHALLTTQLAEARAGT